VLAGDGAPISYTVSELPTLGYATVYGGNATQGFTISNSYTPATTSVNVSKQWDDANNQDGKRPNSVTVHLLADGVRTGKTLELSAANEWKGTFSDLARRNAGADIAYTVEEETTDVVTGEDKPGTYKVEVSGSAADGYQMGQVALDQNQVRVTGPKSEVERVKSAGVIVDISDSDRTVSTNAETHLYDEDGRDIDIDKNLTLNIDKVMVRVEVLPLKVVPIKIAVSGKPVEGYRMTGETSVEPGQVMVAGKKSTLEALSAISIPSSELNVTGRTNDLVKTFDLRNYLPTGVELAEGESETVKVTIEIVETGDE
jgi:YbbR domain-containing protein